MLRTLRDYIESCIIFNVNFMANSLCSAENVRLQLDCFFALRYMELAEDSTWLCICHQDLTAAAAIALHSVWLFCSTSLCLPSLLSFQILINPLSFSSQTKKQGNPVQTWEDFVHTI